MRVDAYREQSGRLPFTVQRPGCRKAQLGLRWSRLGCLISALVVLPVGCVAREQDLMYPPLVSPAVAHAALSNLFVARLNDGSPAALFLSAGIDVSERRKASRVHGRCGYRSFGGSVIIAWSIGVLTCYVTTRACSLSWVTREYLAKAVRSPRVTHTVGQIPCENDPACLQHRSSPTRSHPLRAARAFKANTGSGMST